MVEKKEKLTKSQSQSVLSSSGIVKPKSEEMMMVQLQVIGGGPSEVTKVSQYMKKFTDENDLNIRFIVNNDHIELRSVDWLIAELMQLKEMESGKNGKD